jgi:hypothetical protein
MVSFMHQVAQETAKQKADQLRLEEEYRAKPLAPSYCISSIASDIGQALFESGYTFDAIPLEERRKIAEEALRLTGYGDLAGS